MQRILHIDFFYISNFILFFLNLDNFVHFSFMSYFLPALQLYNVNFNKANLNKLNKR